MIEIEILKITIKEQQKKIAQLEEETNILKDIIKLIVKEKD